MSQVIVGAGPKEGKIRKPSSSLGGGGGPISVDDLTDVVITGSGAGLQYQHLEYDGTGTLVNVTHMQLGGAADMWELRFRQTTNRIYSSASGTLDIDSARVNLREGGNIVAFVDNDRFIINDNCELQFGTGGSQYIAANGTSRLDYRAPTSHDFYVGGTLCARIDATSLTLDPTDAAFIPSFDSSVASTLRLFDAFSASEILRWTGTYQRMAGTNTVQFGASTEYIGCPLGGNDLFIGSSDTIHLESGSTITSKATTSLVTNIGAIDVMVVDSTGITLANTADKITTPGQLELTGAGGAILQYNTSNRVSATSAGVTMFAGAVGVDYTLTLDGETNDCVIKWWEDEDYLEFQDDIFMNGGERIYLRDTALTTYIYSDAAASLTIGSTATNGLIKFRPGANSCSVTFGEFDFGGGALYPKLTPVASAGAGSQNIMMQIGGLYLADGNVPAALYFAKSDFAQYCYFQYTESTDELLFGDGNLIISRAGNSQLRLQGIGSGTASSRRGGEIAWYHGLGAGANTVRGYTYVNDANQFVFDNNQQASNTDTGNAWIDFDDGSASFSSVTVTGLSTGRLALTSTGGLLVTDADITYSGDYISHGSPSGVCSGRIFVATASATVSGTTTQTTIVPSGAGTLTLPASFFQTGKSIRITASGTISSDAINFGNLRFRIKKGTTSGGGTDGVMCETDSLTLQGGMSSRVWHLCVVITGRSTTSVMSNGYTIILTSAGGTGNTIHWEINNRSGPTTAETISTSSEALDLTAQFSNSDSDNSITCTNLIVEVI